MKNRRASQPIGAAECLPGYIRKGKQVVRFLSVSFYGDCEIGLPPRDGFVYRLPPDDARPLGFHFFGMKRYFEQHRALPLRQWVRFVCQDEQDRAPALP